MKSFSLHIFELKWEKKKERWEKINNERKSSFELRKFLLFTLSLASIRGAISKELSPHTAKLARVENESKVGRSPDLTMRKKTNQIAFQFKLFSFIILCSLSQQFSLNAEDF